MAERINVSIYSVIKPNYNSMIIIFYLIKTLSNANLKKLIEETSGKIGEILQENNVARKATINDIAKILNEPNEVNYSFRKKEGNILELR